MISASQPLSAPGSFEVLPAICPKPLAPKGDDKVLLDQVDAKARPAAPVGPAVVVPVSIDKLAAKLTKVVAAAEESFDPISDGQHFFARFVEGATSLADVQQDLEARVADHSETLDTSRVEEQTGRAAVQKFAAGVEALKEWQDDPQAVEHLDAIAAAVRKAADIESGTANLIVIESTGPQYFRQITALVLVGADKRCFVIESEAVG